MGTHAAIELLLETVFSTQSMQKGYKEDNWSRIQRSCVRGGEKVAITKIVLNLVKQNDHHNS
jgi:hypothetical protein